MASKLSSWKISLSQLNQGVRTTIAEMSGWRDPQHAMFLQTVEMTNAQLTQYIESIERLAMSMQRYAQQQIEYREELKRRINSIQH